MSQLDGEEVMAADGTTYIVTDGGYEWVEDKTGEVAGWSMSRASQPMDLRGGVAYTCKPIYRMRRVS